MAGQAETMEVVTKLRLEQTGTMPRDMKETARAAKEMATEMERVKRTTGEATKSIEHMARQRVQGILQQQQVLQQTQERMRARGLDIHGNPIQRPGLASGLGALGQMGAAQLGFGGILMGGMSPAAGAAAGVGAGLALMALADKVMSKIARVYEIHSQPMMSEARRKQAIAEEFTPFSQTARRLAEAVHYAPVAEEARMRYGEAGAVQKAGGALDLQGNQRRFAATEATYRAEAVGTFAYGAMPRIDRSTATGAIQYREAQQRLAAEDAVTRSRRDVHALERTLKDALIGVGPARQAYDLAVRGQREQAGVVADLRQKEERIADRMAGPQTTRLLAKSKAGLNVALHEQEKRDVDVQQKLDQLKQAQNQKEQTQLQLAQARFKLNQDMIGQLQTQLQIVTQREQMLAGTATRIGGMNKGQRMMGVSAMQFIDQFGMESATPEIISAAQQFAPMEMQKRMEKFGERTPEFAEAARRGYADFQGGPLKGLREEQDRLTDAVRNKMQESEQALAKNIADTMLAMMREFIDMVTRELQRARQEWRTGELQRRNQ